MSRPALGGAIVALAVIAIAGFAYVAIHEFTYASDHPYAYGPAKVIAWGAVASGVLGVAVGLVGYALTRQTSDDDEPARALPDRGE
jgi:hypothetical protein